VRKPRTPDPGPAPEGPAAGRPLVAAAGAARAEVVRCAKAPSADPEMLCSSPSSCTREALPDCRVCTSAPAFKQLLHSSILAPAPHPSSSPARGTPRQHLLGPLSFFFLIPHTLKPTGYWFRMMTIRLLQLFCVYGLLQHPQLILASLQMNVAVYIIAVPAVIGAETARVRSTVHLKTSAAALANA
jgi:hypothetical protein